MGDVLKLNQYKKPRPSFLKNKQMSLFLDLEDADVNNLNLDLTKKFNDFFIFSDVRSGDTTLHSWDFLDISGLLMELRRLPLMDPLCDFS